MKKTTIWSALTLLAIGTIAVKLVLGNTITRYIPVTTPHDITDITTNIVARIGRDFLSGLKIQEASIKQAGWNYWESENLLKFYFIIPHPGETLPIFNSARGDPQRLDFDILKTYFPECPKAVLKRIQKAPAGFAWNESVQAVNGMLRERRTYVIQDGPDLIIVGLYWRRNPPSSDGAVVSNEPVSIILPPGSEPWQKSTDKETIPTAQILSDGQLVSSFVEELIGRINDSEDISFADGLRLFHGDGLLMEFQLLRQLGYLDEFGKRLKPFPNLSCLGMLLKMNKGLFSSVTGNKPTINVTYLSGSGSPNGKTSMTFFKVVLSYDQANNDVATVPDPKRKTITVDLRVKTFGKGEKGMGIDLHTAQVDGKSLVYLLGFRGEGISETGNKEEDAPIGPLLYHYPDEKLRELETLWIKSIKEDE